MFKINAETREIIDSILEDLLNNSNFQKFSVEPTEHNWYGIKKTNEFFLNGGCTKGVLIPYDYDFVLKVPYDFNKENNVNYCEVEYANYISACKSGVDNFFAGIDYYGECLGVPIYVQERAECNEDDISDDVAECTYQSLIESSFEFFEGCETDDDMRQKFYEEYYYDDEEEMDSFFISAWGSEAFDTYCDFCWDNEISDVHCGNLGYINGELKVVDYSGYCISYDWSIKHCKEILCA